MRVAFDLSILRHPAAGTARYAVELRRATSDLAGADEIVDDSGWPRRARATGWRLANLASDVGWLTLGADAFALRHGIDTWFGPANSLSIALPRRKVVTIHDTTFLTSGTHDPGYARFAGLAYQAAGRIADAVLAPSHTTRRRLIEDLGVPEARITVAYPGLDHLGAVTPSDRDPAMPARYALTVGQSEPHKNLPALVRAWSAGVPRDLHLLVVGPAGRGEAELLTAISGSNARERIHRLGWVPEDRLAPLYADAACFVFPSVAEGFGFPPLEAMARGVPTAVANASALPEVTRGGAILFDPADPDAIAAAVRGMVEDEDLARSLADEGPAIASAYTWQATAATVWQVIRPVGPGGR